MQTNAHTHTRNARARARTYKSMYRIATQERTQNMPRIVWGIAALHDIYTIIKNMIPK